MLHFQDTFETRKRSFISAFSVCMTVPLSIPLNFSLFYILDIIFWGEISLAQQVRFNIITCRM